jgi:hypothetical protein
LITTMIAPISASTVAWAMEARVVRPVARAAMNPSQASAPTPPQTVTSSAVDRSGPGEREDHDRRRRSETDVGLLGGRVRDLTPARAPPGHELGLDEVRVDLADHQRQRGADQRQGGPFGRRIAFERDHQREGDEQAEDDPRGVLTGGSHAVGERIRTE